MMCFSDDELCEIKKKLSDKLGSDDFSIERSMSLFDEKSLKDSDNRIAQNQVINVLFKKGGIWASKECTAGLTPDQIACDLASQIRKQLQNGEKSKI